VSVILLEETFVVNNLGLEATSTGAIVSFVPPEMEPICAHPLLPIEMVYADTINAKEYKMLFTLIKVFCIANLTGFCYSMVGVNHKVPLIQKRIIEIVVTGNMVDALKPILQH
jgi:hypothetical protein